MNIEMTRLEMIGLKSDLQIILPTLRKLGCIHIDELSASPDISARPLTLDKETIRRQEEISFLAARVEGLLNTLGGGRSPPAISPPENCQAKAREGVETLGPMVQELSNRRDRLKTELSSLPRYEATLRKLLPMIPPSAHEPGKVTVGALVNREHLGVLDAVGTNILELTGGRAEVVAGDVDPTTRAMLVVFPTEFTSEVETLLGREDVSRLRLPAEIGTGPPDVILQTLHRRITRIPEELEAIDHQMMILADQWCEKLVLWRAVLREELDTSTVLSHFGETDMTFVLLGWVPTRDFERVREMVDRAVDGNALMRALPISPELKKMAPVVLQNPRPVQPFESLVNLLAMPKYGHTDPTRLMAFFLPIFFGMILGDIGYGLLLFLICLGFSRRFKRGVIRDILLVLMMGSGWAIVFGLLFGEAFGTLGEHLGIQPLWFERGGSEHVAALLLMTLAVGVAHITLGLILGVWEAIKEHSRSHFLERGGMLVGLVSLFLLLGTLTGYLPSGIQTPAIAGMIIGIVLLGTSLGWLGFLMGPIEFISLIGNVLSYLRIAAIGLASVYLAKVANDVAGLVGNVIIGVIIAVLLHGLNLVMGAFSPTIHSLRLHYVEFFRKFYEGGGTPYRPFHSQLISESDHV